MKKENFEPDYWNYDSTIFVYSNNLILNASIYGNDTLFKTEKYEYNSLSKLKNFTQIYYEFVDAPEYNYNTHEYIDFNLEKVINQFTKIDFEYDSNNQLTSVEKCIQDFEHKFDTITKKWSSVINEKCKTIEQNKYNRNKITQSIQQRNTYQYFYRGKRLIKIKSLSINGSFAITKLSRDGLTTEKIYFDSIGTKKITENYYYIDKKQLNKIEKRTTDGKLVSCSEFDIYGNCFKSIFEDDHEVKYKYLFYTYDSLGNWIECKCFESSDSSNIGELISTKTRKIEYWP
jgi:hypothetical protein